MCEHNRSAVVSCHWHWHRRFKMHFSIPCRILPKIAMEQMAMGTG